jgi:imidazolonepropionase-like amidohydrolase
LNPARMFGREDSLGQIKEGFEADLLVLAANPLDDVTILDKPEAYVRAVMKEGRVYKSRCADIAEDSTAVRLKSAL